MVEDLRRTREQIVRADRLGTLGTLAAGLAHEINNPLVSIHTFMSMAPSKRSEADSEFWGGYHELACQEVDRIRRLVDAMRRLGRGRSSTSGNAEPRVTVDSGEPPPRSRAAARSRGQRGRGPDSASMRPPTSPRSSRSVITSSRSSRTFSSTPSTLRPRAARCVRGCFPDATERCRVLRSGRRRMWNFGRRSRAHFRSLLHHEGARPGNRVGTDDLPSGSWPIIRAKSRSPAHRVSDRTFLVRLPHQPVPLGARPQWGRATPQKRMAEGQFAQLGARPSGAARRRKRLRRIREPDGRTPPGSSSRLTHRSPDRYFFP